MTKIRLKICTRSKLKTSARQKTSSDLGFEGVRRVNFSTPRARSRCHRMREVDGVLQLVGDLQFKGFEIKSEKKRKQSTQGAFNHMLAEIVTKEASGHTLLRCS